MTEQEQVAETIRAGLIFDEDIPKWEKQIERVVEAIHKIYRGKTPVYTLEQIENDPKLLEKLRDGGR